VIGRLEKTVIDCPDPRALAQFYCQVLGMKVIEDIDGWVVIGAEPACGSWQSQPPRQRPAASVFFVTTAKSGPGTKTSTIAKARNAPYAAHIAVPI
jgi:catechol 2,3-dioxygenase-like lactoylglutathione lyase family enzyme